MIGFEPFRLQNAVHGRVFVMSDLVVIEFPTEAKAEEVRRKNSRHAEGLFD